MQLKLFAIGGILLAAGFLIYRLNSLNSELKELKSSNALMKKINDDLAAFNAQLSEDYNAGINAALAIKEQKAKEVRVVERIKQNSDGSCINAINAIYSRLCEQSGAKNCPNINSPSQPSSANPK